MNICVLQLLLKAALHVMFQQRLKCSRHPVIRGANILSWYLHAAEADSYQSGRALLALADLESLLLLCSIVSVLPRAHLQVQNARHRLPPGQVFQKEEFCGKKLRHQNKSVRPHSHWRRVTQGIDSETKPQGDETLIARRHIT